MHRPNHHAFSYILFIAAALFFFSLSTPLAHTQTDDSVITELSGKLLRFRVLANSDSAADQLQKNKVSAELATLLHPVLSDCSSKEEAQSLLTANLSYIEETAAALTSRYGEAYPVSCCLTQHQFPLKIYQDLTFPSGIYDTLLVTIGDGVGSNWWCLAYPPLCFAEEAYVTVPEETENALEDMLSDQTWEAISGQNKKQQAKNKKPKFCFRLLPFLNDLFQ